MYLIHKFYLPVTYLHTYFKNGKRVYFEPNNSQNAIENLKKKKKYNVNTILELIPE